MLTYILLFYLLYLIYHSKCQLLQRHQKGINLQNDHKEDDTEVNGNSKSGPA
jgi:hypothetical protein